MITAKNGYNSTYKSEMASIVNLFIAIFQGDRREPHFLWCSPRILGPRQILWCLQYYWGGYCEFYV